MLELVQKALRNVVLSVVKYKTIKNFNTNFLILKKEAIIMEKQVTTFGKTMVKNIVKGIGIGCTIFTVMSFISSLLAHSEVGNRIASYAVAAFVIGIGYGVFAIFWSNERMSNLAKFVFALVPPIAIQFIVSVIVGWISFKDDPAVICGWIAFTVILPIPIAAIIYYFEKKKAKEMNARLRELRKESK